MAYFNWGFWYPSNIPVGLGHFGLQCQLNENIITMEHVKTVSTPSVLCVEVHKSVRKKETSL